MRPCLQLVQLLGLPALTSLDALRFDSKLQWLVKTPSLNGLLDWLLTQLFEPALDAFADGLTFSLVPEFDPDTSLLTIASIWMRTCHSS